VLLAGSDTPTPKAKAKARSKAGGRVQGAHHSFNTGVVVFNNDALGNDDDFIDV
jgi:hypothetical protein